MGLTITDWCAKVNAMGSTPRDGGPAFPMSVATSADSLISSADFVHGEGMSLRDYFAGQALKSLMSDHAWVRGLDEELMKADRRGPDAFKLALAEHAYRLADAMLAAREF